MLCNRFKNSVTFLYFYFFAIFRKKGITLAYFLEIASKFEILLGLYKKNTTSSLKFSFKWNIMVYSAFLPSIENLSQKTLFIYKI